MESEDKKQATQEAMSQEERFIKQSYAAMMA
jgi:hypothetical protein